MLAHPKPHATYSLTTDASNFAVGAVLQQFYNSHWEPLAFCCDRNASVGNSTERNRRNAPSEIKRLLLKISVKRNTYTKNTYRAMTDVDGPQVADSSQSVDRTTFVGDSGNVGGAGFREACQKNSGTEGMWEIVESSGGDKSHKSGPGKRRF